MANKIINFFFVGLTASLVHTLVAGLVLKSDVGGVFVANTFGFIVAFMVSYSGHYYITFGSDVQHSVAFFKFLLTALIGFGFNSMILMFLVYLFQQESLLFIVVAIIGSAGLVYILSRNWVFVRQG